MIRANCARCRKPLTRRGAVLLSPPKRQNLYEDDVKKTHICVPCYRTILGSIRRYREEARR